MKTRTDTRTPEQRTRALASNERILDWLSRRGLLLLAVILLALSALYSLLNQGESALGRWHTGYATGTSFGLIVAAAVVTVCHLLVFGLRRDVQRDRTSLSTQGGETDA